MIPAQQALARLREGNARFVARAQGAASADGSEPGLHLPQKQAPFAIILGCSDARVPAEIVFDQGPGDLFVIRVAGNIVAPSQLGSIEFAAAKFGTRLVVVLGHSRCGAVKAALEALRDPGQESSRNLETIVNFIRPAVEPLLETGMAADDPSLVAASVRANIAASVVRIRSESEVLRRLIREDGLEIVGAEYDLESGEVEILPDGRRD